MKIVLEGHEFAGKTAIANALKEKGYNVYREPGNENIRAFIKEDLLEKIERHENSPQGLLALAFALDRIYQEKYVWNEDEIYIIDRSVLSSLIMQSDGLALEFITAINSQIIAPSMIFWIRISEKELTRRIKSRGIGVDINDANAFKLKKRYDFLMPRYKHQIPSDFYEIFADKKTPEELAEEIDELIQERIQNGMTFFQKSKIKLGKIYKNVIKNYNERGIFNGFRNLR